MRRRWFVGFAVLAVLTACGTVEGDETAPTDEDTPSEAASSAPASSDATSADAADSSCQDTSLTFIGLEGEEGEAELAEWREARGTELDSSWPGDWAQLISALQVGQTYDLATIPYHQAQRMIASGVLQPLDTSRLENWESVVGGLRESPSLRGEDGEVYGVPIAWGDGPYIYHPERVETPPESVLDLLEPEWEGRFVMFDAPELSFHLLAEANGFTESPLLTPEQLEQVGEQARTLVANAAAFNSGYPDATDRLVSGDVDLAVGGWEAMLTWAAEDDVTLEYGFFAEGEGGWWDGLAIPTTADDVDCAYEYIDAMLAADVQAELATTLVSGAVNLDAVDDIGEEAQIYDYAIVENADENSFASTTPLEDPPEGYTSYQDWLDLWNQIKAG